MFRLDFYMEANNMKPDQTAQSLEQSDQGPYYLQYILPKNKSRLESVLMNRLKKTESIVFLYCRYSLFLKDQFYPDYIEVTTAGVVPCGVCKTYPRTSI